MLKQGTLTDQATRAKALDITKSFIVQAPAGSGKTALLTQRVLALLGRANEPEECLAITFTRKAAAEMRERILQALQDAHQNKPVVAEYDKQTRKLADQVLARDKKRNWNIFDNPNRLKIQTIDSLNVSLTRRMPILSGFGAQPEVVTAANELYIAAVTAVLSENIVDEHYLPYLNVILKHLDNDRELVKKLFISLLPLREQWLPYIIQTRSETVAKAGLEIGLKTVVTDFLQQLVASIPPGLTQLPIIAARAAYYARDLDPPAAIINCLDLTTWPTLKLIDLNAWYGIAELLLTKEGSLRKIVTQAQGFPAPSTCKDKLQKAAFTAHKQSMLACLQLLAKEIEFLANLQMLSYLPPLEYSAQQWDFMAALIKILPLLVAQLTIIFREQGQIDLPEVSMAARMALGGQDSPSDLALALDYKLLHILVDEFQDTSIAQFRLLEHLVAGWTPGDGKTLFLVGDPMQSIYRFRQAEVGLFVNAKKTGIGSIKVEPLQLTANFRSTAQIVCWVNTVFKEIFPLKNNLTLGEVAYVDSAPVVNHIDGVVNFTCFKNGDDSIEGQQIVQLINTRQAQYPTDTIAILVRSRNHLPRLMVELTNANISYQGVEIELLTNKPIIQDLLALTKALLHLSDRISWLAILRAPWCGLTLRDLQALIGEKPRGCVWAAVQAFAECSELSADGRQRLAVLVPILAQAMANRNRQSLMESVYNLWVALSGPLCGHDQQNLADIQVFFELLRVHNNNKSIFEIGFWERQLDRLFSKPKGIKADSAADMVVQVMTIHKAKGLEFDTVILPGLGRKPVIPDARLFRWEERTSLAGEQHLIFAPIKAVDQEYDPIYKFLKYTDQVRNHYELARLLYVATTRAKKALFGFASIANDDPPADSMLELIIKHVVKVDCLSEQAKVKPAELKLAQTLRRLPLATMVPVLGQEASGSRLEHCLNSYDQVNYMRQIGIVVHKIFWQIATLGAQAWQQHAQAALEQQWLLHLQAEGVPSAKLLASLAIVHAAVTKTLADPTGQWILDSSHKDAKSEWALAAVINGEVRQVVIDRTFVDNNGIRWIIDYKTSQNYGVDPAYIKQLKIYKKIINMLFLNTVVKTGLYFSLQSKFQEIS